MSSPIILFLKTGVEPNKYSVTVSYFYFKRKGEGEDYEHLCYLDPEDTRK
jgi:hypothetical protein